MGIRHTEISTKKVSGNKSKGTINLKRFIKDNYKRNIKIKKK